MGHKDLEPLREILHRALVRYLTVTPAGLLLEDGQLPQPIVEARITGFGGARTLYRKRKPVCRSLDGVAALTNSDKVCSTCQDREKCTPQVRLDLVVQRAPYRCLLAFTTARNFLEYEALLRSKRIVLERALHEIAVVNRGSWGELRFRLIQDDC